MCGSRSFCTVIQSPRIGGVVLTVRPSIVYINFPVASFLPTSLAMYEGGMSCLLSKKGTPNQK